VDELADTIGCSDGLRIITDGAPEAMLALCTRVQLSGSTVPFDEALRGDARATFGPLSQGVPSSGCCT
jgi:hypothetical protein